MCSNMVCTILMRLWLGSLRPRLGLALPKTLKKRRGSVYPGAAQLWKWTSPWRLRHSSCLEFPCCDPGAYGGRCGGHWWPAQCQCCGSSISRPRCRETIAPIPIPRSKSPRTLIREKFPKNHCYHCNSPDHSRTANAKSGRAGCELSRRSSKRMVESFPRLTKERSRNFLMLRWPNSKTRSPRRLPPSRMNNSLNGSKKTRIPATAILNGCAVPFGNRLDPHAVILSLRDQEFPPIVPHCDQQLFRCLVR